MALALPEVEAPVYVFYERVKIQRVVVDGLLLEALIKPPRVVVSCVDDEGSGFDLLRNVLRPLDGVLEKRATEPIPWQRESTANRAIRMAGIGCRARPLPIVAGASSCRVALAARP